MMILRVGATQLFNHSFTITEYCVVSKLNETTAQVTENAP